MIRQNSPTKTVQFAQALQTTRQQTLKQVTQLPPEVLSQQAHPDFSPVGWHLGHIAYTESLWIAQHLAGHISPSSDYEKQIATLFSADGLPKEQRQNLPKLEVLLSYLESVRAQTLKYLQDKAPSADTVRLWHWLVQHESQHSEIISMVLAMHQQLCESTLLSPSLSGKAVAMATDQSVAIGDSRSEMLLVDSGYFYQGCDEPNALDNERPAHRVWLDSYWIDPAPITCGQYEQFIEAGGYQQEKWWTPEGWQWQQRSQVEQPLYWAGNADRQDNKNLQNHFVCGVSWYEASAYARFVGKRLPSEAEWEKAALTFGIDTYGARERNQQRTCGVWEWTDSWFAGYPGFQPFPYDGYSQIYFDGKHRVLRGGSWATLPSVVRRSFRNWYHPHRRELFAGFRCAA